ncbi:MAG TPA: hypothetical protein VGE45_14200 [Chloroflexia bacterium]|jgi:hypothetical protein
MLCTSIELRYLAFALVTLLALVIVGDGNNTDAARLPQTSTLQPTPTTLPILLTAPVPDPKQEGVQWFSPTGHTLRGSFLNYWNKYGGLAQFGYPLTEEFYEPVGADSTQYLVQYFERNRFEYHPENKGTAYEVLLGVLGRDFRAQDPQATPLPAPAQYFQETGHNLSGPFKAYWETHGGLFVHGYPITEEFEEKNPVDGKTYKVQYLERSRFELHPENAGSPHEVLLGLLGRQLSEKKGYPYGWYPLFGRAPDFSWVAGRVREHNPRECSIGDCGCFMLQFLEQDSRLSLDYRHAIWPPELNEKIIVGASIVIFGRLSLPVEQGRSCPPNSDNPVYFVRQAQTNPLLK